MATAAHDTLILMESSSLSGTITAGESSDNSLRTLTPQTPLDNMITQPVVSLLVDPIVTIEDLQRDVMMKQKVASSDNILTSSRRLQTGNNNARGYSSMDALNDSTKATKLSVTQQTIIAWDNIVYYLKNHITSGRRQIPLRFKYYRNCFFGSELVSCLKTCLGHSIKDELSLHVLSNKLLQSGVIEGVEECRGKLLFKSTELYRFTKEQSTGPTKLNSECSQQQRRRFIPLGLQTSTMKAMFNIWKLWKKHVSTNSSTPQATYPLPTNRYRQESNRHRMRNRTQSCQCQKQEANFELKKSNSCNTLLEYKAGKSDWVVYGFL